MGEGGGQEFGVRGEKGIGEGGRGEGGMKEERRTEGGRVMWYWIGI